MNPMFPIATTKDGRHLVIREAEGGDAGAALSYINTACGESDYLTFGPGEFTLTEEEEAAHFEQCKAAPNRLYILALIDARIVGILNFSSGHRPRTRHSGELGVSVLKACWGQGIASALFDALFAWARESGVITKINLQVRADNRRAIALYERKGFVVEGTLRKLMYINGVYYDDLWMGREV